VIVQIWILFVWKKNNNNLSRTSVFMIKKMCIIDWYYYKTRKFYRSIQTIMHALLHFFIRTNKFIDVAGY